jgi:hypothetical protein
MSEPDLETGREGTAEEIPNELTIGESQVFWPSQVAQIPHGDRESKPYRLFAIALQALKRKTQALDWIPFFLNSSGINSIASFPQITAELENLFQYELSARFSETHFRLLNEADCIIIGVDKASQAICGYTTMRYASRGSVPDCDASLTSAGMMVISQAYQSKKLAPLMAFTVASYGHSLRSIVQPEMIVVRSNNKYIERILRKAEPVFRSDRLNDTLTAEAREARAAIAWTHENVFHLPEETLQYDEPMKIDHFFKPHETMEGLEPDQIVYLARCSSLAYFFYRVLLKSSSRPATRRR